MQDKMNYEQKLRSIGRIGSLAWVAADRHLLLNQLLAVHYRDGGQETMNVGYNKTVDNMIRCIIENRELAAKITSQAERVKSLMDQDIEPYEAVDSLLLLVGRLK